MKISELAHATDTPADTIRYYERVGLLTAPARAADYGRRCNQCAVNGVSCLAG